LERNRRRLFDALDTLIAWSAAAHEQAASDQRGLFGGAEALPPPRLPSAPDWAAMERLGQEHGAVGFYLSGHPLDDWLGPLKRTGVLTLAEVAAKARGGPQVAKLAGAVSVRQERKSARGNRFAFVGLSDPTGLYEVTVFSDVLEVARDLLEPGKLAVLTVEATLEGETLKLLARSVEAAEAVAARAGPAGLVLRLAGPEPAAALAGLVANLPEAPRRAGPVRLILPDPATGGEIEIELPRKLPVTPQLKGELRLVPGVLAVEEV
jgi:DNA polymerase-3 subunit alpha